MAASTSMDITTSTSGEGSPLELGQPSLSVAPSEAYCDEGHSEATLKRLFGYFKDEKLCDVILIAGGCRIPAHRVVLASCSDFFRAMFTGSMKEAQLSEVSVGDVDSRALEALVEFCYSGTIGLREDMVEALLATAKFMQFDRVANACCAYMQKYLNPRNCLHIALLAEQQFCKELHEEALKYTFKHLMQVVKQDDFLALQPDRLTSLLTSHFLNAVTVQNAFESLIAWVQHDRANREQHLAASLKLLKLHLLPPEYLLDNVERACSHVPECLPLIMGALKRRLLPEPQGSSAPTGASSSAVGPLLSEPQGSSAPTGASSSPVGPLLSEPQGSSAPTGASSSAVGRLYAIGGDDSITGPIRLEMYSPESNSWRPVQGVKGAWRERFGAAVSRGRVVVVGGRDSQDRALNTAESFDLSDTMVGDWSTLAPLNTARSSTAAAALGDGPDATVYVVGGRNNSHQSLRSVERWDARAAAWTLVAPMKDERQWCGVAALRGRLYAVGGWNNTHTLDSVECYDPNTDRWSDCAPMSRARHDVSVCAAGGYLYAIGGWGGGSCLESVERYDPVADTWVTVAPLSYARTGVASCLMGDRIVAAGGVDISISSLRTVEVYDSASDRWEELAPLNTARRCAVLVYVPPC